MISALFYDVAVPVIALLVLIGIFRFLWWLFIGRFERKATHKSGAHNWPTFQTGARPARQKTFAASQALALPALAHTDGPGGAGPCPAGDVGTRPQARLYLPRPGSQSPWQRSPQPPTPSAATPAPSTRSPTSPPATGHPAPYGNCPPAGAKAAGRHPPACNPPSVTRARRNGCATSSLPPRSSSPHSPKPTSANSSRCCR